MPLALLALPVHRGRLVLLAVLAPRALSVPRVLLVPRGHVWVGASSRDPVSYLDRFGKDPTHASFGAVRFRAEDPTRSATSLSIGDHLKYYEPGTESLGNLVQVVVGDPRAVVTARFRGEVRWQLDGIRNDPETYRVPGPRRPVGRPW